jgi:hypothetical protein
LDDTGINVPCEVEFIAHGGDEAEMIEARGGVGLRHGSRGQAAGARANIVKSQLTTEQEGCGRSDVGISHEPNIGYE